MRISNKTKDIIFIVFCLLIILGTILFVGIKASLLFAQTNKPQIENKILSEDEERVERVVAWLSQKRRVNNENL